MVSFFRINDIFLWVSFLSPLKPQASKSLKHVNKYNLWSYKERITHIVKNRTNTNIRKDQNKEQVIIKINKL